MERRWPAVKISLLTLKADKRRVVVGRSNWEEAVTADRLSCRPCREEGIASLRRGLEICFDAIFESDEKLAVTEEEASISSRGCGRLRSCVRNNAVRS